MTVHSSVAHAELPKTQPISSQLQGLLFQVRTIDQQIDELLRLKTSLEVKITSMLKDYE